jgi:hypothetical protein
MAVKITKRWQRLFKVDDTNDNKKQQEALLEKSLQHDV